MCKISNPELEKENTSMMLCALRLVRLMSILSYGPIIMFEDERMFVEEERGLPDLLAFFTTTIPVDDERVCGVVNVSDRDGQCYGHDAL
jgi:hypothetical protein